MKFSKKNRYILLSLLALLNIIIRYPVSHHAYGTDSFFVYGLATSISNYGYAKWVIHPMSLLGLYPLSYPSMYPFLLSGTSVCTNISIEYIILISEIILSILGMLSIYLVAREVKDDDFFSFIVAFVFSLSPAFFFYTNWIATTRGIFISLLPIFIYSLIKSYKKYLYVIPTLVLLLLLMTIHRMFYLIPLILIAYIVTIFLKALKNNFRLNIKYSNIYRLFILLMLISILFYIQGDKLSKKFSEGEFADKIDFLNLNETEFLKPIFNLLVNYAGKTGLNLFFGFLGFIYLAKTKHLTFNKMFFILSVIFLILALPLRYYTPLFYLPFISVFIGYGTILTISIFKHRKKVTYLFIVIILLSSILVTGYMDKHWKKIPTNSAMSEETYNTALFVKEKTNNTLITNEGVRGLRIHAVSGVAVLPFGGPSMHWTGPDQLIYEFENKNNLHPKLLPLEDMYPPPDVLYTFGGVSNAKEEYQIIMYNNINEDKVQRTLLKYNINNVILYKPLGNYFISYGRRGSDFIPTMTEKENKIFDSNSEAIWHLE